MTYRRIDEDELRVLIWWHNTYSSHVTLDTETTDKDPRVAILVDVQISGRTIEEAFSFDGKHAHLLRDLTTPIQIWQNFKYDWLVLLRHGVDLRDRPFRDPMLMSHLLDENRPSHSLDSWVQELFNDDYKQKFWENNETYLSASNDDRLFYGCQDVYRTRQVYDHLEKQLSLDAIPSALIHHVHELARALYETEISGVAIDLEYLMAKGVDVKRDIDDIAPRMAFLCEEEISQVVADMWRIERDKRKTEKGKAGVQCPAFIFESPKQLMSLLYGKLKLPPQKNEKTKCVSVDYASLEKIRGAHPVVSLIQEYREKVKVYGTYIEGTLDRQVAGRIYPEFRINGTKTGRISHSNPNLGQLPSSGGIRGIYVPDPGYQIISADYGMLEVVVEAHYTQDKNLLKIIQEGASKHDITAKALGISRDVAKTLNFAGQYFCGPSKFAQLLGCSKGEGQKAFDQFWATYSGPKKLKEQTDRMVNQGIDIVTLFGRKRRFEVRRRQVWDKDFRRAYNARIQGSGADLTNVSFYRIHQELKRLDIGKGLWTVHDENLIAVRIGCVEQVQAIIKKHMVDIGVEMGLSVPLTVQVSEGMDRWED